MENLNESLHEAASAGDAERVKQLLDRGVKVNARDAEGRTALHEAALAGHAQTIDLLMENGAKVNARDDHGRAALHEAALAGKLEAVVALLHGGASPKARDDEGNNALDLANTPEVRRALGRAGEWEEKMTTPTKKDVRQL